MLAQLVENTFGDYYGTLPVKILIEKLVRSGEASTPFLACFKDTRMCIGFEKNSNLNENLSKTLSGNGNIEARHLRKEVFKFKARFQLILQSNSLPLIDASDGGITAVH